MQLLVSGQTGMVKPFVDNINAVKHLYNEPLEFYFNQENLYLRLPQNV